MRTYSHFKAWLLGTKTYFETFNIKKSTICFFKKIQRFLVIHVYLVIQYFPILYKFSGRKKLRYNSLGAFRMVLN